MPTTKKSELIDNFLRARGIIYLGTFSTIARELNVSRQFLQQRVTKLERENAITVIRTSMPLAQLKAFDVLGRYDFSGKYTLGKKIILPYYYAESVAKDARVKSTDVERLIIMLRKDGLEVKILGNIQTEIWWKLLKAYERPGKLREGFISNMAEKLGVTIPQVSREVSAMQGLGVIPKERGAGYRLTRVLLRIQKEHGKIPFRMPEIIAKKLGISKSYVNTVIRSMRANGKLPLSTLTRSILKKRNRP
ncbi:hypothetical protein IIC68_04195 [archaeon]|nr:hypothetical protein [archaeon]